MNHHHPLQRAVRLLLHWCLAALVAIGLADLLIGLVHRYTPGWLVSAAHANIYWPASWKANYVHWLYSTYLDDALGIGLIGGLLLYWWAYDRVRADLVW